MSRRVYNSIEDLYASVDEPTPLVRVNRLNPHRETFPLYAKLEWYNPSGSIKDRAARAMIEDLEANAGPGPIRLVEPTSGNTGIALATLAAARGHRVRVVVPAKVPAEKKTLLRLAGADVDVINDQLCPAPGLGEGAINLATTYARAQGYAMPNQYENQANARAHETTTGPELWRQTEGRVTHVFAALGTCGTITGLARYLKRQNAGVKIVAVQPTPGHDVPGLRNTSELAVSKLFDPSLIDEIVEIDHRLAYTRAAAIFRGEGLRAGPSSGLIFEGASRVIAREAAAGRRGHAVAIFCDDAFKYTSSFTKHLDDLKEFS
jgi:S-sulfo-L-cysteine synthase (O-acetyl-L-serine-dependent)